MKRIVIFALLLTACVPHFTDQDVLSTAAAIQTMTSPTTIPTLELTSARAVVPTMVWTATATQASFPEPVSYSGSGDDVVEIEWNGPGLIQISNSGSGNFVVELYTQDRDFIELLVNRIGNYHGSHPLNWLNRGEVKYISVKSRGSWQIIISSMLDKNYLHTAAIDTTYTGNGDDFVALMKSPAKVSFVCRSKGTFTVWGLTPSLPWLLVNELSPYDGVVLLPIDTVVLYIKSNEVWEMIPSH